LYSTDQPNDQFAKDLRGFGPLSIIAILIILLTGNILLPNMISLPVGALLVLLWVHLSKTPWSAIGYARPKTWLATIFIGIIFGIAFKFFLKALVMPLFGADPVNESYHFLTGNKTLLPAAIWSMLAAGFGEETVFRGYLFERLEKLLGTSRTIKYLIIAGTSVLFALAHYASQGIPGVEQALITGLAFGIIYSITKKIWIIMIAHAAFDLTALAMIYWNWETDIAHLIFR
jgi:membrane protease YdiL (CAAX protease family)